MKVAFHFDKSTKANNGVIKKNFTPLFNTDYNLTNYFKIPLLK